MGMPLGIPPGGLPHRGNGTHPILRTFPKQRGAATAWPGSKLGLWQCDVPAIDASRFARWYGLACCCGKRDGALGALWG